MSPILPSRLPKNRDILESRFTHGELCEKTEVDSKLELIEEYAVEPPFSSVRISRQNDSGVYSYAVTEPVLLDDSRSFLERARRDFISSLTSYPASRKERIILIRTFIKNFNVSTKSRLSELELEKVFYFIYRELEGSGRIQAPLLDDSIEDISCVGPNVPLHVVHRKYGSIVSNIVFGEDSELDNFVRLIVQRSGKHISIAVPMVDCSLPNGARLQATLGREVTKNGSSFTIRRFKDNPFTPLDLIELGTMNEDVAVYLWQAIEKGENMFIIGGTASGKTTTLNAILLFVPPNKKIVSIEDTKEINIPHENWIQSVTRQGTGDVNPLTRKRVGEVDMFDLLVNSLRQRPDYIIVGEVRGREAYTVFQSMATGQTALSTFHSNDIPSLIHRLEGEPLNIPRSMISSLKIVVVQGVVNVRGNTVRRVKKVVEIVGLEKSSNEVVTNTVYEWDPVSDKILFNGHSYFMDRVLKAEGMTLEQLNADILRKGKLLEEMEKEMEVNSSSFTDRVYNKGDEVHLNQDQESGDGS
jgi:flagellar protein FlaI